MFKCPQNSMLGSAESSPIFLVKKFSFLRLKIGRWFTQMTLKRKQKKHVYKNLIKSAIQQEWPLYALITFSFIYLPYLKKKNTQLLQFFFSNRVSVIWAFLCAIHCKLKGRLSSDDVIWVVPGRFVVSELYVDVANSLNGVWHLHTAELNSTQILDHVKVCVDSVTLTFTRRWIRKAYWGIITSHLAYSSMFFTIQKWKWT